MTYFKIGNTDFSSYVSSLKVAYEVLLSDKSGRNASGNNVVDIVNRKYKVSITLKPLTEGQMSKFLNAIHDYVIDISFLNPKTGEVKSDVSVYTGVAEPEFYRIIDGKILYKSMSIDFIQM